MYKNKNLNLGAVAMVAGVSMEYGLEYYELHERSIDRHKYLGFLEGIMWRNENDKVALIVDQARYHHSKIVQEFCDSCKMP